MLRFPRMASPRANYFLSFSFQSARRSLLFRFARRVPSRTADRGTHQDVVAPEGGALARYKSNDNSRTATGPGINQARNRC